MTYRCMKCGNNSPDKVLECKVCGIDSGFIEVTEENQDSLPFPSNPYDYVDFDPHVCNDKEGICPCGVFIAHLVYKTCRVIETAVPKQPLSPDCYCKASLSPCGHSISHRITDPCTGQP